MSAPDLCQFVFACPYGDWQVDVPPRVRSDLGGGAEAFRAMAEAHRDHIYADHTELQREAMRRQLQRMGAPESITTKRSAGGASGLLAGVELPRWWVHR